MAPRGPKRSEAAEPQAFHQLGVRGRKTGVELVDTGERDEYGMQPLDDLLSSPEREPSKANQQDDDDDDDDDQYDDDQGSEDMDIETSAGPGPRTLLKERSMPYPLPRSRSPVKTQLLSPARRNRNLEHLSSPTRRSIVEERDPTVTRKLDFGGKSSGRARGGANGINGSLPEEEEEEEDADETEDADEPEQEEEEVSDNMDLLEQSQQMIEAMHGNSMSPEPEPEPESEHSEPPSEEDEPPVKQPVATKKARGRPPRSKTIQQEPEEEPVEEEPEEDAAPVAPKRGRKPTKPAPQPKQPKAAPAPASRKRRAESEPEPEEADQPEDDVSEQEPEESAPRAKKQRTTSVKPSKPAKAAAPKAGKPKGRPPRSKAQGEEAGNTSFAALQRGPPMPKSRGLVSVRHDADEVRTTRSGRHSFKPLDWWRGEQVVQEEEEFDGVNGRDKFVLTTIKEVIRKPQEEAPVKKSKGRGKGGRPKRAPEVELEDWEVNPGVVNGEVILWEPEHERHPPADDEPVEVMEDRVAIAGNAIQTKDMIDTTFRFAKTLMTPFMGAGIVDLPPGADKRPKNSRKMHMVFFLHSGKVHVTVNEASFRLSAGGMWFVPRGNYYSITNDYDKPARVFFSQGCEVTSQPTEGEQSQMSMMA
ncbi:mitotic fidelity of chromosome transmission- protein [Fusarium piperis]|uniref:CENP-C homolog n=1 Tax=Fusarium piperis TaxID=1435070 RepID=A0A9W8WLA8_9HYPO|nr:mitotic fidelity of chromosome transmission- protein [Fusarium piperis]